MESEETQQVKKNVKISNNAKNIMLFRKCSQEHIKASRRKLKIIQKDATDKENLVGRHQALLNSKMQVTLG